MPINCVLRQTRADSIGHRKGGHRIRHYALFAGSKRAENIARARQLLAVLKSRSENAADSNQPQTPSHPCPCCGGRMIVIEIFVRGSSPRTRPANVIRIDTSDDHRHITIAVPAAWVSG